MPMLNQIIQFNLLPINTNYRLTINHKPAFFLETIKFCGFQESISESKNLVNSMSHPEQIYLGRFFQKEWDCVELWGELVGTYSQTLQSDNLRTFLLNSL